jgi:hypothetical protein
MIELMIDQNESQLYMGSLGSNDSYRPFPSMNQKRVVVGELSQGQVGDMHLQQGTYVVSSAPVQYGEDTVWENNSSLLLTLGSSTFFNL